MGLMCGQYRSVRSPAHTVQRAYFMTKPYLLHTHAYFTSSRIAHLAFSPQVTSSMPFQRSLAISPQRTLVLPVLSTRTVFITTQTIISQLLM